MTGVLAMASLAACSTTRPSMPRQTPALAAGPWELTVRLPGFPPIRVFGVTGAGDLTTAAVVVVMHGTERNASDYRDAWVPLVQRRPMIVVVPEFPDDDFPGAAGYNLGGVVDADGDPVPRERWTFAAIEPIVAQVRHQVGNTGRTFALFGHSAGAQFVHRYLEFMPQAPVSTTVAANAGWYTMPDESADFPYGLDALPTPSVDLRALFGRDLVVLLGSDDVETENLRRDRGANAQGSTRYQRGLSFFARGRAAAEEDALDFRWRLVVVPGVAHDHVAMSAAAVELIAPSAG
ncbi:hypothetical protein [Oryzobacter telluris]|uniref:hypothetical protein n=1 Tax=Oryzobacter telluris TaxID=3149179 RepID=UPI00370DDF51